MPPHRKRRHIRCSPNARYFKPQGIPIKNLREIDLNMDELEALRLAHIEGLNQEQIGEKMNVSRQTIQRTLKTAMNKITRALVNGYALKIQSSHKQ